MNPHNYKHSFRYLVVMVLFIGLCWSSCGLAQVKVAVIPATWNPERYRDFLNPVFDTLGWEYKFYQNTRLAELMPELKQYNMVVFSTTYNFNNTQDFGRFASEWKAYLESGGCLVVTDANYDNQTQWLGAVDKRLSLGAIRKHGPDVTPKWTAMDHPLMKRVSSPAMGWAQINSWASGWVPLATDSMDRPYVAYQEIGKGVVVVSTCYSDHNWPEAEFLKNLFYWTQSPVRVKALKKSETDIKKPELGVPMLSKFPTIDGVLDQDEWSSAVEVPTFVDYVTEVLPSTETRCRIAQGPDDLYVLFECGKGTGDSALKFKDQKFTDPEREACVEIFIAPLSDRKFFRLAVSRTGEKWAENSVGQFWDRYWLCKTGNQKDRWVVEIRIPFTSLGLMRKIPSATMWGANFARRHHPSNWQSEAFVWVPALTQNELKNNFGLLSGIKVNVENYTVKPEMTVQVPEKWLPGENNVRVDISASYGSVDKTVLSLKTANSTDDLQSAKTVTLKSGQVTSIFFPIKLDVNARLSGQFVLSEPNVPSRILASSPTIEMNAEPLMLAELILPAYRNIVQSMDPKKELIVCGQIEKADFEDLCLESQVRSQTNEKLVWRETQKVRAGSSFEVKTSLANLPVGKYRVYLTLTSDDTAKKFLSEKEFEIAVLPPAAFEVTFDERRICYVNGEPFFPIGLYHTSPLFLGSINAVVNSKGLPIVTVEAMLKDVKDHGFNIAFQTHAWAGSDEAYLKLAKELGLYVASEIGSVDEATFKSMVGQANRIGNILMWYTVDEPDLNKIRYFLPEMRDMYQRIDPHRPTGAAICFGECIEYFPDAYDILMLDIYPFNAKPDLASTGLRMDEGLAFAKNRRPMWIVPQAFADDRNNLVEPTPQQLSAQAYFDIVHGATGLIWYSYFEVAHAANPKGRGIWFLPDSPLWPCFKELNREVTEISPVILSGEPCGFVKWDSPKVDAAMWKHEGSTYIIAVNPTNEKIECSLVGLRAKSIEVLFEERKMSSSNGILKDTFDAYGRHIYRFTKIP